MPVAIASAVVSRFIGLLPFDPVPWSGPTEVDSRAPVRLGCEPGHSGERLGWQDL
jgi:hypothetical protein